MELNNHFTQKSKMFIVKKHESEDGTILLAIIDEELEGKKITEGNKVLELNCEFYKGDKVNEEELNDFLKKATHINIVGNNITKLLGKSLIDSEKKIGGIRYAQAVILS